MATRRHPGFTMIEVLVVISIIVFLIAMLLPALKAAQAVAKGAQCLSNLRQIGIATSVYANNFDAWLPPMMANVDVHGGKMRWPEILMRGDYVSQSPDPTLADFSKPVGVFACPSEQIEGLPWYRTHYGMNHTFARNWPGHPNFRQAKLTPFGYTNATDFLPRSRPGLTGWIGDTQAPLSSGPEFRVGHIGLRHQDAANVVFFDMHAEAVARADIPGSVAGNYFWDGHD